MWSNSLSTAINWIAASPACSRNTLMWRVSILRWALGSIYLWFGGLKLFPGLSSAEHLAGATLEIMTFGYLTPDLSLPVLGLWEAAIGLALMVALGWLVGWVIGRPFDWLGWDEAARWVANGFAIFVVASLAIQVLAGRLRARELHARFWAGAAPGPVSR